jgi:hypothetical protein
MLRPPLQRNTIWLKLKPKTKARRFAKMTQGGIYLRSGIGSGVSGGGSGVGSGGANLGGASVGGGGYAGVVLTTDSGQFVLTTDSGTTKLTPS